MIAVTIIYDIGKTNKKMAVLDHQLNILYQQQITIDEIYDEDNFPSENLAALTDWMFQSLKAIIESREFIVEKINFSAYGATMVHLDNNGKVLTPVYNYLKNIPENIVVEFLAKYSSQLAVDTASPVLGMLNAGMQLYWLKYTKPEIYGTIKYALHLPQYLSYFFTGKFYSDITSIGCHTLLWYFERNDYHDWVYQEGIHEKLAPIQEIDHMELVNIFDQKIRVGIGVHDSSATLVPYLKYSMEKFILLSTGTWCVTLNPFRDDRLTEKDMDEGCLNYIRYDKLPVRATSIFLGNEYQLQIKKLCDLYKIPESEILKIEYNNGLYEKWSYNINRYFCFSSLDETTVGIIDPKEQFQNIHEAYHKLILELTNVLIDNMQKTVGADFPNVAFVDGGFTQNSVFLKILQLKLSQMEFLVSQFVSGAVIGAAILIAGTSIDSNVLKPILNFEPIKF